MRGIRLGHNAVPGEAEKDIVKVFRSGQYSPGRKVKDFEEAWAKVHQAKHAIFVNSGTDALRMSLLAMKEKYGWADGDEVAVPALTFVATVNVILQANLKPRFVDVSMYDYLINSWNLEHQIECSPDILKTLKAIVPVHLFGQSCREGIYALAKKYKLKVLEDSCETILNKPRGQVSCHSTYMAHHVTTGVGGMAVTDDNELNLLIRSYANHGRNTVYLPGYTPSMFDEKPREVLWLKHQLRRRFQFDRVGYSCRGTEFEAVLGLSQMGNIKRAVEIRQCVASGLITALSKFNDYFVLRWRDPGVAHTWMMFPIVLNERKKIDKYDLCLHLERNGVETRDMMPITNQPCYRDFFGEHDFPVASDINKNGFYIPVNPGMTQKDINHIARCFDQHLTTK